MQREVNYRRKLNWGYFILMISYYIKRWFAFGWRSFKQTAMPSCLFSSIFLAIAIALFVSLHLLNADLVIYPFVAGFFLVAPLLIIGFQRVGHKLKTGKTPTLKDFFINDGERNPGIWFAVFILSFCYFIWITDALVIYGLYFGLEPIPATEQVFTDPVYRGKLFDYLFYSALMGLVTAIIGFLLGVFSIPLMVHEQTQFVEAVHISLKTVMKHKMLMAVWASLLVIITTFTLVLALPFLIVVFPVLGFASYAVYDDLIVHPVSSKS